MIHETHRLITAATATPFEVAEFKAHARIDASHSDAYIRDVLIPAAVGEVEAETGFAMMAQTWRLTFRAFPVRDTTPLRLRRAPYASITSFTYTDTAGASQTMVAGTDYTVDAEALPAALWPYVDTSWPTARDVPNSVIVDYVVGATDPADVNPQHRLAAMQLCEHWYENRSAVEVGQGIVSLQIPETIRRLLSTERLFGF